MTTKCLSTDCTPELYIVTKKTQNSPSIPQNYRTECLFSRIISSRVPMFPLTHTNTRFETVLLNKILRKIEARFFLCRLRIKSPKLRTDSFCCDYRLKGSTRPFLVEPSIIATKPDFRENAFSTQPNPLKLLTHGGADVLRLPGVFYHSSPL